MGFRLDRTYKLSFEGTVLAGAEVRIRSTPVSVVLSVVPSTTFEELAQLLVDYVIDWNLEDHDGNPIKLEKDAILSTLEQAVLMRIMKEWMRAARGISAPLDLPSEDGAPSPELNLPMEVA